MPVEHARQLGDRIPHAKVELITDSYTSYRSTNPPDWPNSSEPTLLDGERAATSRHSVVDEFEWMRLRQLWIIAHAQALIEICQQPISRAACPCGVDPARAGDRHHTAPGVGYCLVMVLV